jgi:cell division protein FtsZ
MDGKVRVSVVATGMDTVAAAKPAQPKLSVVHTWDGRQGTGQAAGLRTREAAAAAVFAVSHSDADAQGTLDAAVAALAPERTELRAAAGGETAQGSGGADDGDAQSRNIFIPPAPVLKTAGDGRKGNGAGAAGTAKPADADSGGGFAKMSNLFHRVTGSLSGKGGRADSDGAAAEDHQDTAGKASPRFGSVNPEERLPASRSEDELLDIPAFLRRQAN